MSLESNIEGLNRNLVSLNEALDRLIQGLYGTTNRPDIEKSATSIASDEFKEVVKEMPEAPFKTGIKVEFPTPEPAPQVTIPFTDVKGLTAYVIAVHTETGGTKAQEIQDILDEIGTPNLNDVNPKDFALVYAKVEALRK